MFGYFGQINQFKGVDVLLRACDLLAKRKDPAGRLQIRIHGNMVGQAPSFVERFEKAVSEHPFLSYAGPYSNSMVRELMSSCDCVLVPSTWWENSPLVIQEAYAARCPVVCSGIGGMAEKVADGISGLHFRAGDAADLLRAMSAMMDDATHSAFVAQLPVPISDEEMALKYLDCFAVAAGDAMQPSGDELGPPEGTQASTLSSTLAIMRRGRWRGRARSAAPAGVSRLRRCAGMSTNPVRARGGGGRRRGCRRRSDEVCGTKRCSRRPTAPIG